MHSHTKNTAYYLQVVFLALIIGLGLQFAEAWTTPSVAPPTQTIGAPITTSATAQTKSGSLGVSSLLATGAIQGSTLKITTGAGAGKVLTSDASGNATWKNASGGGLTTMVVTGPVSACRGASTASCPAGYTVISGGHSFVSSCGCSENHRFPVVSMPSGNAWVSWTECATSRTYAVCAQN